MGVIDGDRVAASAWTPVTPSPPSGIVAFPSATVAHYTRRARTRLQGAQYFFVAIAALPHHPLDYRVRS
jgi:hypothetical protein